jgi:hypothetical protein
MFSYTFSNHIILIRVIYSIRQIRQCDLKVLQANSRFINAANKNMDTTDAVINVCLIPWSE